MKEENAELLINGKRVESDYTFTADSETMKVEVAFTFDATSLDGKQLVTFEELYDLSNPDEPKKVTEHKDIEDKDRRLPLRKNQKSQKNPKHHRHQKSLADRATVPKRAITPTFTDCLHFL